MTVQIFPRVAGDTGPPVDDVLEGVTDLTSVTSITAYLYRKRETTAALPVTIVDPVARQVRISLSSWLPTARSGDWSFKYRATFASNDKWTWESARADVIRVGKDPAA